MTGDTVSAPGGPHPPRRPQRLGGLRKRAEFLSVAAANRKWAGRGLVLQARPHDAAQHPGPDGPAIRFGLTASRKVGGAVVRNRARRRLRALAAEILPREAAPGHDYVLIARPATANCDFDSLRADLRRGLAKLRVRPQDGGGERH